MEKCTYMRLNPTHHQQSPPLAEQRPFPELCFSLSDINLFHPLPPNASASSLHLALCLHSLLHFLDCHTVTLVARLLSVLCMIQAGKVHLFVRHLSVLCMIQAGQVYFPSVMVIYIS